MPVPVVVPEDGNLFGQEAHAEPFVDVVRRVRVRVRVRVRACVIHVSVPACVRVSCVRVRVIARVSVANCVRGVRGLTPKQV